jgi:DNA polymerase III sliding clamp (beta) subunit (PCNA family)
MATAISILVDEATFKIDPDGLKLRAMDPSRVAMIDFEWPKTILSF